MAKASDIKQGYLTESNEVWLLTDGVWRKKELNTQQYIAFVQAFCNLDKLIIHAWYDEKSNDSFYGFHITKR